MRQIFHLLLLCLLPAAALAQTDSGTIRVLVTDGSTAPVAEAQVKLTNVSTGVVTTRLTGEEGYAIFSPIVRGAYVAEIAKAGFQPTRVTDLRLDVDERKLVRVTMQVSSVSETVEVSAAADIVQSEQASLGQVIRGSVAVELPLAARRYTDLALLVPGATESTVLTTTRGPGWFVVNGNYQAQNNFIVDGVDNNQGTTNAQALSAQVVQPSPDAISEFKVQTNSYSAEFGRSAGAAINVVIKSGTNQTARLSLVLQPRHEPGGDALVEQPDRRGQTGAEVAPVRRHVRRTGRQEQALLLCRLRGLQAELRQRIPGYRAHARRKRAGVFYRAVTDPDTKVPFPNNTIPANAFRSARQETDRPLSGGQSTRHDCLQRPND